MRIQNIFLIGCLLTLSSGCTNRAEKQLGELQAQISALKKSIDENKPGLGEIMTTIHLHHAKLFYAGQNQNWKLANYQLDEIKEGLDQATQLHEHIDGTNASLKDLRHLTDQSLESLEIAIKENDKLRFQKSFQALTTSCNQCHKAAGHEFIVVQIPSSQQMFSNQKFTKDK